MKYFRPAILTVIFFSFSMILAFYTRNSTNGTFANLVFDESSWPRGQRRVIDTTDGKDSTSRLLNDYSAIRNAANDFKNYWLLFRSIVNGTRRVKQKKNIDDGYLTISNEFAAMMELTQDVPFHELHKLSDYVQNKIKESQNPPNCYEARLMVGDIRRVRCGFGCVVHVVVSFLITALRAGRTLVLLSEGWKYAPEGWEYIFLPLSNCTYVGNISGLPKQEKKDFTKRDESRITFATIHPPDWIHWAVPQALAEELKKHHGNPYSWWISQLVAYVTRMQPWFEKELSDTEQKIGFSENIAGLQIRWGDKIKKEANKHSVEEHMFFIEQWHKRHELRGVKMEKVVFLATEEEKVRQELREKYPEYKFISIESFPSEGQVRARYTHEGLESVLKDIYFLSRSSYLVCTLSSNVCRSAYERMLYLKADISLSFQTVDTLYRFRTDSDGEYVALADHNPVWQDELKLKKGDKLKVFLDPHLPHDDGFYRGKNKRTGKEGKFPAFKVREEISTYIVPSFTKGLS